MLGILEAELVGNLANGQFCFKQKLLRPIDDGILDVMLTGDARLLADEVTKVLFFIG